MFQPQSHTPILVKIVTLVFAFVLALAAILFLQRKGLEGPLRQVGLAPSFRVINVCANRIGSIELGEHALLYQVGRQWRFKAETTRILDTVSVEKWLARHCQIPIVPAPAAKPNWQKFATFRYLDGSAMEFYRDGGLFSQGDLTFRSQEFSKALAELLELPEKASTP